jgi:hypothetical protein
MRSASWIGKSLWRISISRSGIWLLNSATTLATAEAITIKEETSCLESTCQADSSVYLLVFSSSSAAFSVSLALAGWILAYWFRITWVSRAVDLAISLSQVVVREAWVVSSSWANSALASLELLRACSATCRAVFSSAKDWSTTDRVDFSLDSQCYRVRRSWIRKKN